MEQQEPTVRNFITALRSRWLEAMSGAFSVPFTVLAVVLGDVFQKTIFGIMAFGAIWFAAYRLWATERRKLVELTNQLTPKFKVSFNAEKLGIVDATDRDVVVTGVSALGTPINRTADVPAKYLRLTISANAPVHSCEAYIVSLEKCRIGEQVFIHIPVPQPVPLQNHPFDVKPRINSMVDFIKTRETKLLPTGYWPNVLENAFDEPATYRFTFNVHGDGITSDPVSVDVHWQGQWNAVNAVQVTPPE